MSRLGPRSAVCSVRRKEAAVCPASSLADSDAQDTHPGLARLKVAEIREGPDILASCSVQGLWSFVALGLWGFGALGL